MPDEYVYLLDAAFAGDDWHSLITNVKAVGADEWLLARLLAAQQRLRLCRRPR